MLLSDLNCLQCSSLHRHLALLLSLWVSLPLLRRMLVDVLLSNLHRLQNRRYGQSNGQLSEGYKVLSFRMHFELRELHRWML